MEKLGDEMMVMMMTMVVMMMMMMVHIFGTHYGDICSISYSWKIVHILVPT